MDMIDGPVDGFYDLDGAAHVPILVFELGSLGRAKRQLGGEAGPGVDGDTSLLKAGTDQRIIYLFAPSLLGNKHQNI